MRIRAIFRGVVDSLGYEKGKPYTLVLKDTGIGITREDGTGLIYYKSLPEFLLNWVIIL